MKIKHLFILPVLAFISGCSNNTASSSQISVNPPKEYGFNEAVQIGDFEYTIKGASNTKQIGSSYVIDETEYNFVIVNMSVKNIGKSEVTIYSKMMLYYIGENEYEPRSSSAIVTSLEDGFASYVKIGAGLSKTLNVVYEIPNEYQATDYLLLKDSINSNAKSIKVYMR